MNGQHKSKRLVFKGDSIMKKILSVLILLSMFVILLGNAAADDFFLLEMGFSSE